MKLISGPVFKMKIHHYTSLLFIICLFMLSGKANSQCVSVGSDQTICQGGTTASLGGAMLNGTTAVLWDDGGVGGTFLPNTTTAAATWTPPAAYTGTATLTLAATAGCTSTPASAALKVIVNANVTPSVSITADPSTSICSGTSVTFTATPVNGGTPTYQWRVNGGNVGTNSSTYTSSTLNNGDAVSVVMTSSLTCVTGSQATSNILNMVVTAKVTPSVSISANPSGAICAGTSVTFTAAPVNGGTPTYQWSVNGIPAGTNSSTYTSSTLNDGDVVSVLMTSSLPCVTSSQATSNTINMVVTPKVTPSVSITANPSGTICSGTSVTFTATPVNGGATPTYQWKVNSINVGSNSPTYMSSTLNNGDIVTVAMTSSLTCVTSSQVNSNAITMSVTTTVIPSVSITANPSGAICSGTSVTFTAVPVNGGPTPSYQWKINGGNVGMNSPTFTSSTLNNADIVSVVMTSSLTCVTSSQVPSNAITMTVNPLPAATLTSSDADNRFCAGTSITFTAGGGTNYNFRVNSSTVQNTTLNTYTTNALTNGQVVDVIVTNSAGCSSTSSAITNTVDPLPVQPMNFTTSTSSVCQGSTGIAYTVPNDPTVTYNWSYSGTGATIHGTTNSITVDFSLTATSGTLSVTATNGCGTSAPRTLAITVNTIPSLTLSSGAGSTNQTVCQNSPVAAITYFVGGSATSATVSGLPSGVTGAYNAGVFTISGTPTVSGTFNYTVSTTGGTCTPATATGRIVVNALPIATLVSSDADNIFCSGTPVTFTATGGTNYEFKVSGTTVQNGPTNTYTTSSLLNTQIVTVIVTNTAGCSTTPAGITNSVNPAPVIVPTSQPTCSADYLTYSMQVYSDGTLTSTAGTVTSPSTNNWSIANIPAGTNITLTSTSAQVCISTMPVTAPNCTCPVINPPVSGGDKSYCSGSTIPALTATVGTGQTVDWYAGPSGGTPLRSGSLSFTPSAAGTYYAQAREIVSGCTSTTRTAIILTMNPLPVPMLTSSDADNIFCAGTSVTFTAGGGTTYNFRVNGATVQNSASATYTTSTLTNGQVVSVIVTNATGCSATSASITNTVNPAPVPTLVSSDADNIICDGASVTFTSANGTSYNFMVNGTSVQQGPSATYTTNTLTSGQKVSVTVTDANGCQATSAEITNTINPAPIPTLTSSDADNVFCAGTGVTFTAGGGSSYNFRVDGNSVQNGTADTFLTSTLTNGQVVDVIVSNTSGCADTSTGIANTVYPQPVADAGAGGNSCDTTFTLGAVPSIGIGTWTKVTGPGTVTFSPNANTPNADVAVSDYGSYTFRWTEVSGPCSSSASINVDFYLRPVADAGLGGNNCGLTYRLNGSLNTGVGTWAKVSGPGNVTFSPDANTPGAMVTVSSYGTYTFSWTVVNGTCTNSSNVTVVFIQQAAADGGSGGDVCDTIFNLKAVAPSNGTGFWSLINGPGNVVYTPDSTSANAMVSVDQFGSYNFAWTVVNSTCTSSDLVNVNFHDVPLLDAGADTVICKGDTLKLNALGSGSFRWTPVDLVSNPDISDPEVHPDSTTHFIVELTDQYTCRNSDTIVVEVREIPVANAGPDQNLWYQFTTTMDATLNFSYETGVWSVLSGTGTFADTTYSKSTLNDISLGENRYLWSVSNGYCPVAHDTLVIVVNNIVVPTLITPNMDGRNDYFVIKGLESLGKTELDIFDRRGVRVYRNTDYDNSWNGVDYNDKPLRDDTYFYVIKPNNGKPVSGYIVIRH